MNGELVDWDDARIHVGAHGLHYGTGVCEGIRCYDTPQGPAVFRLTDHMQRLHRSARLIDMELPYSIDELRAATNDVLTACNLRECYIRPIAFYGFGELGVKATGNPVDTVIMAWPWGLYLGDEVFMCGTAAEITPVRSVDDHEIGVGEITLEIQRAYLDIVRGASDRFAEWRELVPTATRAA